MMKFGGPKIYTVHLKPDDRYPHETVEFVEENANIWGFVFHGFWLLYSRAYLAGAIILLFWTAFVASGEALGLHVGTVMVVELVLRLFVCFDGNDLRRSALKRRGYILSDIVIGDSELAAKQRFFQRWLQSGQLTEAQIRS
jgi:hypothetical protein